MTGARVLELSGLQELIEALAVSGYTVIGPTVRDGAITPGPVSRVADLPVGWGDDQDAGRYSEAPRGVLFHRYVLDADGIIQDAQIVPPTSQNQASIEADLRSMASEWSGLDDHALQRRCEHAIRNYDPCISCATHLLDLTVARS